MLVLVTGRGWRAGAGAGAGAGDRPRLARMPYMARAAALLQRPLWG